MQRHLSRRDFFGISASSACFALSSVQGADHKKVNNPVEWTTGCFNRPWGKWTYDQALRNIKSAGYQVTGLLGDHKDEPFILPGATSAYLQKLKQRIKTQGLSVNVAWLRTNHALTIKETIHSARIQIDNAAILGIRFLLTTGVSKPDQYKHYYQGMADASEYAAEQNMQIVLKPHGGCSASSDELLRCVNQINRNNFRIWYDAGNIIHYTGKDPVADMERVIPYMTGFCAKDCDKKSGKVMIQFGSGKVEFRRIFSRLKDAGFRGPVMVECCDGQTLEEVTANAQKNREYLYNVLADL